MSSDAIETLARICADRSPSIPLWQAKVAKSSFELDLVEIRG
jgi:hypothetical protein